MLYKIINLTNTDKQEDSSIPPAILDREKKTNGKYLYFLGNDNLATWNENSPQFDLKNEREKKLF